MTIRIKKLLLYLSILSVAFLLFVGCQKSNLSNAIVLVKDGQSTTALVIPKNAPSFLREIADSFVNTVHLATGADIPIVFEDEAFTFPMETTRIFLGNTQRAKEIGLTDQPLPEEGYRMLIRPNEIFILGSDETASSNLVRKQPTRWALNQLLEEGLGVRWLWPGRLGTYIPKSKTFIVSERDLSYQPQLSIRYLRLNPQGAPLSSNPSLDATLKKEAGEWGENHQFGRRVGPVFGHSFRHWWEKYGEDHPFYFAESPTGKPQPGTHPDRIKLRLAEPRVIEQIAKEYTDAGTPLFWNVCPNDGHGFDLSEETRAWDIPHSLDPDQIWKGKANLTPRFVEFWNRLSTRLQQINPDVILCTYAYASYREPPPKERPLQAPTALMVVPGFHDFQMWSEWSRQPGIRSIFLRPNWGHLAAHAPYLPLEDTHTFLEFCWKNKMEGFDNDSINGFWATQGSLYYLWARMLTRPDLSLDALLQEYTSAFGEAAPLIRAYLDYWQKITSEIAIVDPYAYETTSSENGRFAQLLKEGKTETNFVRGSRRALPYLYTDAILKPAQELLRQALIKVGDKDPDARDRILFLQSGLEELQQSRDLYALAEKIDKKSPEDLAKLQQASDRVVKFREQLTPTHAIWGNRVTAYEDHYKVPVRPSNLTVTQPKLEGM